MRLLLLHISDIHADGKSSINEFQTQKIVDALGAVGEYDEWALIISGDIAHSGEHYQYQNAWRIVGNIIAKHKAKNAKENGYVWVAL